VVKAVPLALNSSFIVRQLTSIHDDILSRSTLRTADPPGSVECCSHAKPKVKPKVKQERTVSVKRGGKFPSYFLLILGIFQVTQHTCTSKNISRL